jgi:predicted Ser/Thr protein kinase
LKVNKEEMHHPHKHILVCAKNKKALIPVMIDFERCHLTSKPTNVTQFLEFICRIHKELSSKGLYFDVNLIRNFGKEYREDEAYFKKIIGYFSSLNS